MVAGFFGGLASGLLGLGATIFGNKQQQSYNTANMATQNKYNTQEMKYANELNKDLAKYNQGLTIQNLQSTPYALRQGMEYAGFNPILAYSNGNFSNASQSGSSPALGSSLPSSPKSDYASVITNAFQNGIALQNQINQNKSTIANVGNVNADTLLKKEMTKTEVTKQRLNMAQKMLHLLDSQIRKKDIDWYERKQLREEKKVIIENERNSFLREQARASTLNSYTNAGQLKVERDVRGEIIEQQREYNEWAKKHPYLKSIDQTLTRYFNGFGANIGATKRLK